MTAHTDPRAHHPDEDYIISGSVGAALRWLQARGYAQLNGNVFVWTRGTQRVRVVDEALRLRSCRPGARLYRLGAWWSRCDRRLLEALIAERDLVVEDEE